MWLLLVVIESQGRKGGVEVEVEGGTTDQDTWHSMQPVTRANYLAGRAPFSIRPIG